MPKNYSNGLGYQIEETTSHGSKPQATKQQIVLSRGQVVSEDDGILIVKYLMSGEVWEWEPIAGTKPTRYRGKRRG